MDHYLDIHLHPDPEFAATVLMSALFAKLHRGLVKQGGGRVGVSFPDTHSRNPTLGHCLRVHGSQTDLLDLMALEWISGMRDHCACGEITHVPNEARYRVVARVQAKSSPERLRRRLMLRSQVDAETALHTIPDSAAERLKLPYVTLSSATTGQRFNLFIEHGQIQETPTTGVFSAYGLSSSATVPWF